MAQETFIMYNDSVKAVPEEY